MSVDELQRAWKEQDRQRQASHRQARQQQVQQDQVQQDQVQQMPARQVQVQQRQVARAQDHTDGQEANRETLDMALDYLQTALEAVVSNAGDDRAPTDGPSALGGGPPPGDAPPADNGSGEM